MNEQGTNGDKVEKLIFLNQEVNLKMQIQIIQIQADFGELFRVKHMNFQISKYNLRAKKHYFFLKLFSISLQTEIHIILH
jgi:hypothetical protein